MYNYFLLYLFYKLDNIIDRVRLAIKEATKDVFKVFILLIRFYTISDNYTM